MRTGICLVLASLVALSCAKERPSVDPSDIRTRIMSPDGSMYVECPGPEGCPEEVKREVASYKPPTRAQLDETRRKHIYELAHPKDYGCTLPIVPRESFIIRDGGPSANLPGDTFLQDAPIRWGSKEKVERPQIRDDDKPIGVYQQGDDLTFVYRLRETGELVTCGRWYGKGIPDTCELKYRVEKELCSYAHTIIVGH